MYYFLKDSLMKFIQEDGKCDPCIVERDSGMVKFEFSKDLQYPHSQTGIPFKEELAERTVAVSINAPKIAEDFSSFKKLKTIYLTDRVETIAPQSFKNCDSLEMVYVKKNSQMTEEFMANFPEKVTFQRENTKSPQESAAAK